MTKEEHSFANLITDAYPKVRAFCRQLTQGRDGADDLAQIAAEKAWKQRALYDPTQSSVSTWMGNIAKREYIDHGRRAAVKKRRAHLIAPGHAEPNQEHAVMASQTMRAVHSLPLEQRDALLAAAMGETQSETVVRTKAPLGSIKSRQRMGREKLIKMGL
ncbi:MAG: hypothetical protein RLZZ283_24 [Candidatus Parcubacteria bacterium]|jgi:RNA polymerase sigma-70 factor (ECF subfamily)